MTERRTAQERLRENEARQALLLRLSDVLRPVTGAQEAQEAAMKLPADFEIDADQNGFTVTARHERDPVPMQERMRLSDGCWVWTSPCLTTAP